MARRPQKYFFTNKIPVQMSRLSCSAMGMGWEREGPGTKRICSCTSLISNYCDCKPPQKAACKWLNSGFTWLITRCLFIYSSISSFVSRM